MFYYFSCYSKLVMIKLICILVLLQLIKRKEQRIYIPQSAALKRKTINEITTWKLKMHHTYMYGLMCMEVNVHRLFVYVLDNLLISNMASDYI